MCKMHTAIANEHVANTHLAQLALLPFRPHLNLPSVPVCICKVQHQRQPPLTGLAAPGLLCCCSLCLLRLLACWAEAHLEAHGPVTAWTTALRGTLHLQQSVEGEPNLPSWLATQYPSHILSLCVGRGQNWQQVRQEQKEEHSSAVCAAAVGAYNVSALGQCAHVCTVWLPDSCTRHVRLLIHMYFFPTAVTCSPFAG